MSEKKGWGKTVLGWFVVQEGGDPATNPSAPMQGMAGGDLSADELIAKYAAADQPDPPPPPPPPVTLAGPLPPVVNGTVDFDKVFEAAGVSEEERGRVQKALELLSSLPVETPEPIKKQIVEASLKAFGVSTELIIEAAVEEMEALEAFIRQGGADAQNTLAEASRRITELDAEIQRLRQAMDESMAEQRGRTAASNTKKLEVQKVLEFFGQDAVAKVVRDSPRLHEPDAQNPGQNG